MRMFHRSKPRETGALYVALGGGTYEEFTAAYDPAWVHYDGYSPRRHS